MLNKQHYSVACAMIVAMFLVYSCALIHRRNPAEPELSVNEYFPHNAGAKYTYRIIIDKQSTERTFQWKGADSDLGNSLYPDTCSLCQSHQQGGVAGCSKSAHGFKQIPRLQIRCIPACPEFGSAHSLGGIA